MYLHSESLWYIYAFFLEKKKKEKENLLPDGSAFGKNKAKTKVAAIAESFPGKFQKKVENPTNAKESQWLKEDVYFKKCENKKLRKRTIDKIKCLKF